MHQLPSSQATRYCISYSIRDGEHEYADSKTVDFAEEPTEEQIIHALIEAYHCAGDEETLTEEKQQAWTGYRTNGCLEIPGDYRIIDDIAWERDPGRRVLITVSGGVAEYAADNDVAVCLIDWDNEPNKAIPDEFCYLRPALCQVC